MKNLTFNILSFGVGCLFLFLQVTLPAQESPVLETRSQEVIPTQTDVLEYRGFSYVVQYHSITILKYTGSRSSITIPSLIDELPVTRIAERAFISHDKLKSVSIPSSVISIGEAAFAACPKLAQIEVDPYNPVYSSIDGVLFSKDATTLIQCPAARKGVYTIPLGTTVLGAYSFLFCQNLQLILLPEGVQKIGDHAFENTLVERMELPSTLQSLGRYVFASCDLLKEIRIPDNCKVVINAAAVGNGTKADITRWKYDETGHIVAIEGYSVTGPFPLDESFFVQQEGDILSDRQGLVYSVKNGSEVSIIGYKYKYPAGKGTKKKTSRRKHKGKALVIPSVLEGYPVTSIADRAFFCSYQLEGVSIPDSVTSIGDSAFMYCTSLTNVVIPLNVTNISFGAFRHCNSLTNIDIMGNKLTHLGEYAFNGCSNLSTIYLPNSVESINEGVFRNCTSLLQIHSGINLTNIGKIAFEGCSSLNNITLSDNLMTLGETFETCSALESFQVSPANPNFSDLDGVLYNKQQTTLIRYPRAKKDELITDPKSGLHPLLQSYTLPQTVTNVYAFGFSRSMSLTNIALPESLTQIGPHAFYMCTNLAQITIPDGILSIPPGAFSRCTALTSAVVGSGVTRIYPSAFSSCNQLTRIYFRGNAPINSDGFIDDWHRLSVYRLENTTGWDSIAWKNKAKRLWELGPRTVLEENAPQQEPVNSPADPPTEDNNEAQPAPTSGEQTDAPPSPEEKSLS